MQSDRTVALVGRPNVGKSRLFNRLARRRIAIVHDQPGVTRDVNAVSIDDDFILMDTGGIGLERNMDTDQLISATEEQVDFAVQAAQVICLVVDGREGATALDDEIAASLRRAGKKPILVVNKLDAAGAEDRVADFDHFGFDDVIPVSAEHGRGESLLREAIAQRLGPPVESTEPPGERRIRMAFVGRPNVGKSSLCNRLLQADRLVVSEVPGTTRDSVELDLDWKTDNGATWPFRLIDTAGLRKRASMSSSVEYFSSLRSRDAIAHADVVYLVIDALEGVTTQDKSLAGEVIDAGKSLAVIVNKWDLALETFRTDPIPGYDSVDEFRKKFAEEVSRLIFFLPDSPIVFVSAKTGFAVERLLKRARDLDRRAGGKIPTPRINQLLHELLEKREPKIIRGKRFKIFYATQTGVRPIRIRCFCNQEAKLDQTYRRYLQNAFIEEFDLAGCSLRFDFQSKQRRYAAAKRSSRRS